MLGSAARVCMHCVTRTKVNNTHPHRSCCLRCPMVVPNSSPTCQTRHPLPASALNAVAPRAHMSSHLHPRPLVSRHPRCPHQCVRLPLPMPPCALMALLALCSSRVGIVVYEHDGSVNVSTTASRRRRPVPSVAPPRLLLFVSLNHPPAHVF